MTAVPVTKEFVIAPPDLRVIEVRITGESPYLQHRFWKKGQIQASHEAGAKAKNRKNRDARNFSDECREATHYSVDGWIGIPAASFRNAMISACRVAGYVMTKAKLSFFCLPDGIDDLDGQPLVRIEGEPEETVMVTRNDDKSVDLRARPMWRKWGATVRIRYDASQFSDLDIVNLLHRAGMQVGIGEGRPDSKNSPGMGYGLFTVESK